MVNCNPETVSTDYDTSDRLFFEPLTRRRRARTSATRCRSARRATAALAGVDRRARRPDAAEARAHARSGGRSRCSARAPTRSTSPRTASASTRCASGSASRSRPAAPRPTRRAARADRRRARLSRCSCGRRTCSAAARCRSSTTTTSLDAAMAELAADGLARARGRALGRAARARRPLPRRRGRGRRRRAARRAPARSLIGGVMEHIEEAGVHSGDSACAIPPPTLDRARRVATIEEHTRALADALDVRGLLNVQYAVKDGERVRDRGEPAREPHGAVREQGDRRAAGEGRGAASWSARRSPSCATKGSLRPPAEGGHVAVKEAVLPFNRFPDVDTILGPEMRSTGEVMGIDRSFGLAFAKSQAAAGNRLPAARARCSSRSPTATRPPGLVAGAPLRRARLRDRRRPPAPRPRSRPRASPVEAGRGQGRRGAAGVDAVDLISSGKVDLVVNTPRGRGPRADGAHIRRAATAHGVPCVTTVAAALAAAAGIAEWPSREADGAVAAGVPPRRPAPARGLSASPRAAPAVAPRVVDLTVELGPLVLPNPIVAASGTFGHGDEVARLVRPGAPRRGHGEVARRVRVAGQAGAAAAHDRGGGMLNSVGLQGPGVDAWIDARPARAARARRARHRVDLGSHRRRLRGRAPRCWSPRADELVAVEVNVSCPNVAATRATMFAHDRRAPPRRDRAAVVDVGGSALPVFAKLSPNVTDLVDDRARRGRRRRDRAHAREHGDRARSSTPRRAGRCSAGAAAGCRGPADQAGRAARGARRRARAARASPIIGTGGVATGRRRGRDAARGRERGRRRHRDASASRARRCASLDELDEWCATHGVDARRATSPERLEERTMTTDEPDRVATAWCSRSTSATSTTRWRIARAARSRGSASPRSGYELYAEAGPGRVRRACTTRASGCSPTSSCTTSRTRSGARRACSARHGVEFLNFHAAGGDDDAARGRRRARARARATRGTRRRSRSRSPCSRATPTRARSTRGSRLARDAGCDGVVCAVHRRRTSRARTRLAHDGARHPARRWRTTNDQARVATPGDAIARRRGLARGRSRRSPRPPIPEAAAAAVARRGRGRARGALIERVARPDAAASACLYSALVVDLPAYTGAS